VTKFRRAVFTDDMLTYCQHNMGTACAQLDIELIEFNGQANHPHPLVAYPSTPAISTLVRPQRPHRLPGAA
jgi:putative transposase